MLFSFAFYIDEFYSLLLAWWVLDYTVSGYPNSSKSFMLCQSDSYCISIFNFPVKIHMVCTISNSNSISSNTDPVLIEIYLILSFRYFFTYWINIIFMYETYLNDWRKLYYLYFKVAIGSLLDWEIYAISMSFKSYFDKFAIICLFWHYWLPIRQSFTYYLLLNTPKLW